MPTDQAYSMGSSTMPSHRAYNMMAGRQGNNVGSSNSTGRQGTRVVPVGGQDGFRRNHGFVFLFRLSQMLGVSLYLCLIIYAAFHKGWWLHLRYPMGFGIAACAAAYFAIAYTAVKRCGYTQRTIFSWKIAFLVDFVTLGLWCTALVAMCLPKGKDYRHLFETPPYYPWCIASLTCASIGITFGLSAWRISVDK